jgi:hypothetical protein
MARYNKIFAGPVSEPTPQVRELAAGASILPGSILVVTSGVFQLAGTTSVGKVFIAQDNYLLMKNVDQAWDADDTMIGMEMLPTQFFNARVAAGANLSIGTALTPAASGTLGVASTSDMVVAFAEEAYNNTTGAVQLVRVRAATGYLTAAA